MKENETTLQNDTLDDFVLSDNWFDWIEPEETYECPEEEENA